MNATEILPEILTLKETATYFRCSDRHIQNLLLQGLPHFRLGSLLRFKREEVLAFLAHDQRRTRHKRRAQARERLATNP